jgi:CRP-like cAMP-binding protein
MNADALSVAERIRTLGICPVFARIPSSQIGVLAEMMETERLETGEALFEHGEPADRMYVVAGGTVGVFLPGRTEPVRTLEAGGLLGEYGMFSARRRTAAVRAETDAVLLSLDYLRFRAFLLQFPEATLALLKTAVQRLIASEAGDDNATDGAVP